MNDSKEEEVKHGNVVLCRQCLSSDHASGNLNQFVGICTQRSGKGLGATFILRNVVDGQGVEICYEMYSPRLRQIEVLKLEKRLDDNLMYLRDALPEYNTFEFDLKPVRFELTGDVPVNSKMEHAQKWAEPWRQYDMLREYDTSSLEEQILQEVQANFSK